jgi:hypothetical protein
VCSVNIHKSSAYHGSFAVNAVNNADNAGDTVTRKEITFMDGQARSPIKRQLVPVTYHRGRSTRQVAWSCPSF